MLQCLVLQHLHGMKSSEIISVRQEFFPDEFPGLSAVSERLDPDRSGFNIDVINWKAFSYKPKVSFDIRYTRNEILLKYNVTEKYFRAEARGINQRVWEDSCVEFFISPEDDGIYYNLEFNAAGAIYMGAGSSRHDRKPVPETTVSLIRILPSVEKGAAVETGQDVSWSLTVAVPLKVFLHHNISSPKNKIMRANFYKCGDKLKIPHYLSWNPVSSDKPDFHRPECFGILKFI